MGDDAQITYDKSVKNVSVEVKQEGTEYVVTVNMMQIQRLKKQVYGTSCSNSWTIKPQRFTKHRYITTTIKTTKDLH